MSRATDAGFIDQSGGGDNSSDKKSRSAKMILGNFIDDESFGDNL